MVRKIRYNGLKQPTRIVNRDYIIAKRYPDIYSTFVDVERLKKCGRSLEIDKGLPRKFLDIGKIEG